jgi:hypothetical protein
VAAPSLRRLKERARQPNILGAANESSSERG